MAIQHRHYPILLFAAVLAAASALADDAPSLEIRLNQQFKSRNLAFRTAHPGQSLIFNAEGKCLNCTEAGIFAKDGCLQVLSVRLQGDTIQFEGQRLVMYFEPSGHPAAAVSRAPIHVTIQTGADIAEDAVQRAIDKVFLPRGEGVRYPPPPDIEHLSGRWEARLDGAGSIQARLKGTSTWQPEGEVRELIEVGELDGQKIYLATKALTTPEPVEAPAPEYPEAERGKRAKGSALVEVVVDTAGLVHSIQVLDASTPLFGAQAVLNVSTWKFQPATLNHQPVSVVLCIGLQFTLF